MSFFSNILGSVGSSLLNSGLSSLTSSLFGSVSSGFSALTSGIGGFFSGNGAGSSGLSSLFSTDTFDDASSIQAAASSPSAGVDVRAGAASANLGVARFASSFDSSPASEPILVAAETRSPAPVFAASSEPALLQLRQPVTDSSQFDRLFPSFNMPASASASEVALRYDPGLLQSRHAIDGTDLSSAMSPAMLAAAAQADGPRAGRTDGVPSFGADNFRAPAPVAALRAPGVGDSFFDRPVTMKNVEDVVGRSEAEKLSSMLALAVPGGQAAKFTAEGERLITLHRGERWLTPTEVFDPGFASTAVQRGVPTEQRSYSVLDHLSDDVDARARTGLISTSLEKERAANYAKSSTGDAWVYQLEVPISAAEKVGGIDKEVLLRDRGPSSWIRSATRVRQGPGGSTQYFETVLNPFFGK
jgi:hypothetical protein